MSNPFDHREEALIEMSRLQREAADCTATRRVLTLIDAGLSLEEAEAAVFGLAEWRKELAA